MEENYDQAREGKGAKVHRVLQVVYVARKTICDNGNKASGNKMVKMNAKHLAILCVSDLVLCIKGSALEIQREVSSEGDAVSNVLAPRRLLHLTLVTVCIYGAGGPFILLSRHYRRNCLMYSVARAILSLRVYHGSINLPRQCTLLHVPYKGCWCIHDSSHKPSPYC